ncbi:MAG: DUF3299 domain-containing protein, partial [Litoreibacter sp.]
MVKPLTRRGALALLAGSAVMPCAAIADEVIDLGWDDLRPEGDTETPQALRSLMVDHNGPVLSSQQPVSSGVRSEWNGQIVRLPGFIVPIEHVGTAVSAFILVPFAGACVHVPPPPANQLVFVTTPDPYESKGLYAPVHVTGMFGISSMSTQLAQVGYALSAEKIEPFRT